MRLFVVGGGAGVCVGAVVGAVVGGGDAVVVVIKLAKSCCYC